MWSMPKRCSTVAWKSCQATRFSTAFQPTSSVAPKARPCLRPAPASQTEKPYWLWSRPVPTWSAADWVNGVRPNSVVKRTSVSSSRPRCRRSLSRPATGWSMRCASWVWLSLTFSWPSQLIRGRAERAAGIELHEPHALLDQPAGEQAIAAESRGSSSWSRPYWPAWRPFRRDRSVTRGTASCILAASS